MADGTEIGVLSHLFPHGVLSVNTLLTLVYLLGAYFVAKVVYSLTLHPLANIPGPKICAITRLPYWVTSVRGRDVFWMDELHKKYGPVVRFGPQDVSYITAQAWKDILAVPEKAKAGKELGRPLDFVIQPVNGVYGLNAISDAENARVRRIFTPAFSDRALRKQEPLFKKYADLLICKLRELCENGKPVEMTRPFNFATFDVMAELCFGHPLGLLEKNEFSPWVNTIFEFMKMQPIVSMIMYYPISRALFTRFEPKSVTEQRIIHCQHSADRVNQRLQEGSDRPDIWNLVMSAQESEKGLTLEEMHSNAELFMIAGSETTATLLSGVVYYLLMNPAKMTLLCKEIRGSFDNVQDITFERIAGLKYLNACLKETLRLYPPVPAGSPWTVPKGGWTILGWQMPPQTRVSVHHYAAYHSPNNFTDPEIFAPERWLSGASSYGDQAPDVHQPFGYGPRNCIGQNMAMHEMRLILTTLLFTFDLELCDESRGWTDQKAFVLWSKKPLRCRLKPLVP
ncbi:cytochrome P450 [Xylariaceae sp. FL0662B]|nr:cytochrome P450 [Xylariaceae sp. FL0662B]